MFKTATVIAAALVSAIAATPHLAQADSFVLRDENGKKVIFDTASHTGCKTFFDTSRRAFEICPVDKVVVIQAPSKPKVGLGSTRQQMRATARRVNRRHGMFD